MLCNISPFRLKNKPWNQRLNRFSIFGFTNLAFNRIRPRKLNLQNFDTFYLKLQRFVWISFNHHTKKVGATYWWKFPHVWSPGKSYAFLQNFALFWKIRSVLMVCFPPGKSYVFLQNFEKALLIWKIYMCSYTIFGSLRKINVFL